MIIQCINCNKKFSVNSELIPSEGRTIQCGSCNHVWFFQKKQGILNDEIIENKKNENIDLSSNRTNKTTELKTKKKTNRFKTISKNATVNKNLPIKANFNNHTPFTFTRFLSLILVLIISFIGLIIVLDTFKNELYTIYPDLEFILFNLYETLKDIELFIKDLI